MKLVCPECGSVFCSNLTVSKGNVIIFKRFRCADCSYEVKENYPKEKVIFT